MTRWKEAVGENPLGSVAGIVRVWQEWLIRDETLFLLWEENDDEMPAFAVIKGMECSRVNWPFPGKEQSLSKKSAEEWTRRNA